MSRVLHGGRSSSGFIDTNKFDQRLLLNRAPIQPIESGLEVTYSPAITRQPEAEWIYPLPSGRVESSGNGRTYSVGSGRSARSARSDTTGSVRSHRAGNPSQWDEVWAGQYPPTRSITYASREPLIQTESFSRQKTILGLPIFVFWITTSILALIIAIGLGAGLGVGLAAKQKQAACLPASSNSSSGNANENICSSVAGAANNTVTILSVSTKDGEKTTISTTITGSSMIISTSTVESTFSPSTVVSGTVTTVVSTIVSKSASTTTSTSIATTTTTTTATTTITEEASQTSTQGVGSSPAPSSPCTGNTQADGTIVTPQGASGSPILFAGVAQQFKIMCNTNWPSSPFAQQPNPGVTDIMKVYAASMDECIMICAQYSEGYDWNTNHGKTAEGGKCVAVSLVIGQGQFCFLKNATGENVPSVMAPFRSDSALLTS